MCYYKKMTILGIDEVGRGPWAGPLVIGAVVLPAKKPAWVDELTDSKKLSAKKRELLSEIILKEALATGLGWVSSKELDGIGLAQALRLATCRAVEEARSKYTHFHEIVIDGTINFLADTALAPYVTTLPKADFLIKEVSAASIIAKVARDHYMYELADKYPEYGFEKHVGYGTAAHKKALETYGPCPEHRKSFRPVENIIIRECPRPTGSGLSETLPVTTGENERLPNKIFSTSLGRRGETVVADYLANIGHIIIARNHKTKFYEIDIISAKGSKIYFTEVKYRKNQSHGTSLEQITQEKLRQMNFAAESFLKFRPDLTAKYNPMLAAAAVSGPDFHLDGWFPICD